MTPEPTTPLMPSDADVGLAGADRCEGCVYADHRVGFVPGSGPLNARLILIGEAPGREEVARGVPFIGASGRIIRKGLDESRTFITNLRKCLPPEVEKPVEREASIAHCSAAYLQPELDRLTEARAVHLVGGEAALAVAGVPSILEAHGAVYTRSETEAMVRAAIGKGFEGGEP